MSDRRGAVSFDPAHFAALAARGERLSAVEAFRQAYRGNLWSGPESRSGPGSSLDQTALLRRQLPDLCRRLGVATLLDLPCGDLHWMSRTRLPGVTYLGADLLPEIVARNSELHGTDGRRFLTLDLTSSPLPEADLLLCRDCLVHLSYDDIRRALVNIRKAPITWLLTTTFPAQAENEDITTGDWRPLNLQLPPFTLPPPVEVLLEGCSEQDGLFADKSLGLWRVDTLSN